MSERKKLEEANEAYKASIEKEINEVKSDVNKVGKNALIGGLVGLSVLALTSVFSGEKESKKSKKKRSKKNSSKHSKNGKNGVLLDTLKDEVLLIGLAFAAQKLSEFIKDVNKEKGEQSS